MSKILVIGNGFDLAHGLPTKYTDFLDFSELFMANEEEYKRKLENMIHEKKHNKEFLECVESCRYSLRYSSEYLLKFKHNKLIDLFLEAYMGDKWIDFENCLQFYILEIVKLNKVTQLADLPDYINNVIFRR